LRDWQEMTGNHMSREQMAVIRAIDAKWQKALADERERYAAEVEADIESKRGKG
jgi:hypothetical protein